MDEITSKYHSVDFQEPRRLRILVNWPVKARISSVVSIVRVCAVASPIKLSNRCSGERLIPIVDLNYLCEKRSFSNIRSVNLLVRL